MVKKDSINGISELTTNVWKGIVKLKRGFEIFGEVYI